MRKFGDKARHFRIRAEELRSVAHDVQQPRTREMLERTARELDQMAERYETIAKALNGIPPSQTPRAA